MLRCFAQLDETAWQRIVALKRRVLPANQQEPFLYVEDDAIGRNPGLVVLHFACPLKWELGDYKKITGAAFSKEENGAQKKEKRAEEKRAASTSCDR